LAGGGGGGSINDEHPQIKHRGFSRAEGDPATALNFRGAESSFMARARRERDEPRLDPSGDGPAGPPSTRGNFVVAAFQHHAAAAAAASNYVVAAFQHHAAAAAAASNYDYEDPMDYFSNDNDDEVGAGDGIDIPAERDPDVPATDERPFAGEPVAIGARATEPESSPEKEGADDDDNNDDIVVGRGGAEEPAEEIPAAFPKNAGAGAGARPAPLVHVLSPYRDVSAESFAPLNEDQWVALASAAEARDVYNNDDGDHGAANAKRRRRRATGTNKPFGSVTLVCTVLQIDAEALDEVLGRYCDRIVALPRSAADVYPGLKPLPFIQDLIDAGRSVVDGEGGYAVEGEGGYYLMLTNADVSLPRFANRASSSLSLSLFWHGDPARPLVLLTVP